ncbi:MAG TPA: DUF969 domain-containing protein [Gemmatimonadaceae bacterium]
MLPLIGILIVVVGFALRLNPLSVVATAAIATGLAAHRDIVDVIGAFGKAFIDSRSVAVVWLALPVIGLLERAGLKERARTLMANIGVATTGRLLFAYLAVRQITSALGLTSLGGHPQMVRPLIAPMAEAAAENKLGRLNERVRTRVRAHAAAADNIGLFFGEDIFIAIGSILLIRGFLDSNGIHVEPTDLAIWAIPTAICAFVIHGVRLLLLDRKLAQLARESEETSELPVAAPAAASVPQSEGAPT